MNFNKERFKPEFQGKIKVFYEDMTPEKFGQWIRMCYDENGKLKRHSKEFLLLADYLDQISKK